MTPDLPQTYVACRCGHLNSIHLPNCAECGAPKPRVLDVVRCSVCGDEDRGPWLTRDGRVLCEACDEVAS